MVNKYQLKLLSSLASHKPTEPPPLRPELNYYTFQSLLSLFIKHLKGDQSSDADFRISKIEHFVHDEKQEVTPALFGSFAELFLTKNPMYKKYFRPVEEVVVNKVFTMQGLSELQFELLILALKDEIRTNHSIGNSTEIDVQFSPANKNIESLLKLTIDSDDWLKSKKCVIRFTKESMLS